VLIGSSTNLLGGLGVLGLGGAPNNAGISFGKTKTKYESSGFSDESEDKFSAFNLAPTVGIMATDKVMVGLSAGIYSIKFGDDDDDEKLTITSLSPFIRAYLKKEGKALPYLEARAGVNAIKFGDDDEDKESAPFFGGKLGGAIFLSEKVSLDLFVDYNFSKDEEKDNGTTTTTSQSVFGLGLGFSVFL
jgi:hypothetical protein